jgi:cytidylate kinase
MNHGPEKILKERKKPIERSTTKVILSSRLAGWLMFNAFHLVGLKPDAKERKRNIFIFNDTIKLQDCINDYAANKLKCRHY